MKLIFFHFDFLLMLLYLLLSDQVLQKSLATKVGINYGQKANDLPSPYQVLQSIDIGRVKLYDADPKVLHAFLNSNVEFIISISDDNIQNMTDPNQAEAWIKENVQPFLPQTRITCITVGNEDHFNPTLHNTFNHYSTSFPPFLINAYPYFAYKASPNTVSLDYVLFEPNPGVNDTNTNLTYDNMLYAQVDSVYAAIKAMGHTDILVRISETGWPSKGDSNEPGATVQNAATYNGNLLKRIDMNQGTPLNPDVPIDVYVFALFNEDQKPDPTSERNYGLFYPDGTPVYNIGLQDISSFTSHSGSDNTDRLLVLANKLV